MDALKRLVVGIGKSPIGKFIAPLYYHHNQRKVAMAVPFKKMKKNLSDPVHPDIDDILLKQGWTKESSTREQRPMCARDSEKCDLIYADRYLFPGRAKAGFEGVTVYSTPYGFKIETDTHRYGFDKVLHHFCRDNFWEKSGMSYSDAIKNIESAWINARRDEHTSKESIDASLFNKFPELSDQIRAVLGDLGTKIKDVDLADPNSRNEVLKIDAEGRLPFALKAYVDVDRQIKEAKLLTAFSRHERLQYHMPRLEASGWHEGLPCNAIEDPGFREPFDPHQEKTYEEVKELGINLREGKQTQLMYVLALVNHYGPDIINEVGKEALGFEYIHPEIIRADMRDLQGIDRKVDMYKDRIDRTSEAYEITLIHNDALRKNCIFIGDFLYLIDWERAAIGPIEHDLRRGTLEAEMEGNSTEQDLLEYRGFREYFKQNSWLEDDRAIKLVHSMEEIGNIDRMSITWWNGRNLMDVPEEVRVRDHAITGLGGKSR